MCTDAAGAIAFYERAFGATLTSPPLVTPDGVVMNAELSFCGSCFLLAEANERYGTRGPTDVGATTVVLQLYVPDVDAAFERAVEAGCEVVFPVADQFYGHRSGRLRDPFGHAWILSTRTEEVDAQTMRRRFDALWG